jgi:hypothetical protein
MLWDASKTNRILVSGSSASDFCWFCCGQTHNPEREKIKKTI